MSGESRSFGSPFKIAVRLIIANQYIKILNDPYSIGQIDAYFRDAVPETFWKALAVYVAHASLYSIKWAERFGQEDIDGMIRRCRTAFEDYDGFRVCVPKWYTEKYRA